MTTPISNTLVTTTAGFHETLTRAVGGEACGMDVGAATLASVLDKISEREQYLLEALRNLSTNRPYLRSDGNDIYIGPIGGVGIYDTAVASGSEVRRKARTSEQPLAFAGLTANNWYYVYAYVTGGVLAFELVTTVPDPATGYTTKTGGTDRHYIGAVRAIAADEVRAFTMQRGRYLYSRGGGTLTFSDYSLKVGGTAASWTAATDTRTLADFVPPHALTAILDLQLTSAADANETFDVRANGETAATFSTTLSSNASSSQANVRIEVPLFWGGTHAIEYQVTSGGTMSLYAAGFQEP